IASASVMFPVTVRNPARDKFGTPNTNNLKDVTIVTTGALRIDGIDDRGPFSSNSAPGGRAVKLDGAAIPPGSSGTVVVDLNFVPSGVLTVLPEVSSFKPPPRQPVQTLNFGFSDLIFSAAVSGGENTVDFGGVTIPANQFGYFYQVIWNGGSPGP